MRVKMAAVVLAVLMFPTEHAQAEWHFKVLDYPAATDTQVFGINNHGTVVGSGFFFGEQVYWSAAFTYDSRKQVFTPLPPPPLFDESDLAGIADSGVMVGSVYKLSNEPPEPTQYGFTLSKDGKYRLFSHPGSIYFTGPRAINEKGLVTGWCDNSDPNTGTNGFIYDPKTPLPAQRGLTDGCARRREPSPISESMEAIRAHEASANRVTSPASWRTPGPLPASSRPWQACRMSLSRSLPSTC
jgi:hypothetical protein